MNIYSPFLLTPDESHERMKSFDELVSRMNVSDENLINYVQAFFESYRATLEQFFNGIAPSIPFYANHPFETFILRLGPNGIIIGHRPSQTPLVKVMRPADFDPPLDSINIFDVAERWQVPSISFDSNPRTYSLEEAKIVGIRNALASALDYFWQVITPIAFEQLCINILEAEGVRLEIIDEKSDTGIDAKGLVYLEELGGFRRYERWGFQFKHYRKSRASAKVLRELETYLEGNGDSVDVVCLITSGDLTSIGNHITVENPRIRVWDRQILDRLLNIHIETLKSYFADYPVAIDTLSQQVVEAKDEASAPPSRKEEFENGLCACPAGQKHFSDYERIGTEIWQHTFNGKLGAPKPQSSTSDQSQRRDVLFPNRRGSPFFQRIAQRFDADFVIVDFKNYGKPITPKVLKEVEQYANKAVGRFIVIACRVGASKTVERSQHRIFRDKETVVLIINDVQMIEMLTRKEQGQNPEDVLEDLLDEFLRRY